jgi:hypothetical protein
MADQQEPNVGEAFSDAVKRSRLGAVSADEQPTGAAILAAIGGVRGLVESILPSFVFLVVYLLTKDVVLSALVPVGVAVVFIIVRVAQKLPVTPAITGAVGVGITALLAIVTGRAENNFVPGMLINAAFLIVMLVSIIARRPLVGFVAAVLVGERAAAWREQARSRRLLTLATWFWVALFGIRLLVEVPLYLAGNPAGLAVAKLILGVPLYAVVLWVSWLLVRALYPPEPKAEPAE